MSMSDLQIERIEVVQFSPTPTHATSDSTDRRSHGLFGKDRFLVEIHTNDGTVGEYVSRKSPAYAIEQIGMVAESLLGRDPLHREEIWNDLRFMLRKSDRVGIGPIDIALWDLAGKYFGVPVHELLGTYRTDIPAYAASSHGNNENGLDSPDAYADFAEVCLQRGFSGFKIHTWEVTGTGYDVRADIELIRAVGERVGGKMDLMLDLSGKYSTLGDAIRIGRVCDEFGFFWLEDPYGMAGISETGHRRLRERVETPLLQLEHVRGLESHADFVINDGTDFVRINPELDEGITGSIKIARSAESMGVDVEFNGPGPDRRHCLAAIRNANYYEITDVSPAISNPFRELYLGTYNDGLDSIDDHGRVSVPDGPGLGVEFDRSLLDGNLVRELTFR